MKIIALFLCLSLLLGLFSGCAAEDTPYVPTGNALAAENADLSATEPDENAEPQKLTMAYYADRSLNPFTCTDFTNRTLFSLIYQGLFSVSRDYQAVPILCDRYSYSSDSRSYTFYLADAVYSDGTPVTVDDVLASYQAAKESSYYAGRFTQIKSIDPSEDGGITFTLATPMENLTLLLDVPIIKASEIEAERPLGTGPYILEESLTGAHLRRNLSWWCSSPDLIATADSIALSAAESPIQIRDEFEFADVGLVCANPCSDSYADYRCDYELWDCETGIFLFLGVNVAYSKDDIFSDTTLRAAITYAIDREKLAENNYRGFARPATLAASPGSPFYSAGLAAKYEYEPLRFVEALGKVDLPKEPLRFLVNKDDSLRLRTARDIAAMLEECGLDVELEEVSSRVFQSKYVAGDFDLYLGQTRLSANMDLSPFFRPYGNISRNGTADATIYEQCRLALENSGNFYNLHKAVADDGRIIPILFCNYAVYATRGLLTELQPARDNVFFYTLGRTDEDAQIPIDYSDGGAG